MDSPGQKGSNSHASLHHSYITRVMDYCLRRTGEEANLTHVPSHNKDHGVHGQGAVREIADGCHITSKLIKSGTLFLANYLIVSVLQINAK